MIKTVIFSDLDGTLLDHHSYQFDAAKPVIDKCRRSNIPIIPTTSKTFAEVEVLRKTLHLNGPFIVENGAAVYIPHGFFETKPPDTLWRDGYWVHQLTSRKHFWSRLLKEEGMPYQNDFIAFSEMSDEEIAELTGLTLEEAKLASKRQYGEPILWTGTEAKKKDFVAKLRSRGARPLQGGRFLHISGETDKGEALRWMMTLFKRFIPLTHLRSIALGDGQNDAAMLEAADIAVRIKSPVNDPPLLLRTDDVYDSTEMGPQGWAEVLNVLLTSEFHPHSRDA